MTLTDLPNEVLLRIIHFVSDKRDNQSLCMTSKRLWEISNAEYTWTSYLDTLLPEWREYFSNESSQRGERSRRLRDLAFKLSGGLVQVTEEGVFIDGKKEGTHRVFSRKGRLVMQEEFRSGERHGLQMGWWDNGHLESKGMWVYGKPVGTHWGWWQNGRLQYQGKFKDGKKDGIHRSWGGDGQLLREEKWKNGKLGFSSRYRVIAN